MKLTVKQRKALAKFSGYRLDEGECSKGRILVHPKLECGIYSFSYDPLKDARLALEIFEIFDVAKVEKVGFMKQLTISHEKHNLKVSGSEGEGLEVLIVKLALIYLNE